MLNRSMIGSLVAATVALPAAMVEKVKAPDRISPTIEGSRRLFTISMPRAASRSLKAPPTIAPMMDAIRGIAAR